MARLVVLSVVEQVTAYLRGELLAGAWSGLMPGGDRLAADLGVGRETMEAVLKRLEKEGLLINQGRRRGRQIVLPSEQGTMRRIRMGFLLSEKEERRLDYVVEFEHELEEAGHMICCAPRSMIALGMDVKRIAAMVEKIKADAWLVISGSREVLEWFADKKKPAFAVFGRREGLALPGVGPDKAPALVEVVRTLAGLGHRRIVLLTRKRQRLPEPGRIERAFLDELAVLGIPPGPYNLPDWEENVEGLEARLETLFHVTPPTALILDEAPFFVAASHFLGSRGLGVPEDVSLVCNDADPAFGWCNPPISHIHWDSGSVVKRIVQWAANVSRGKKELKQTWTPAEFIKGGTIGPAKG